MDSGSSSNPSATNALKISSPQSSTLSSINTMFPFSTAPPIPLRYNTLYRYKSRILASKPRGSSESDQGHEYLLTSIGEQFIPRRKSSNEDEVELKPGYEIPPIILRGSKEVLVWDAPLKLRSPLDGVYHSGDLKEEYFSYLKTLNLKSVLSLLPTDSEALSKFLGQEKILYFNMKMPETKDGVLRVKMAMAVKIILDKSNHPILFFSRQGKHRVGCILGMIRKLTTDWGMETLVEEYHSLVGNDSRDEDIDFIFEFDESGYGDWVKGYLEEKGLFVHDLGKDGS